MLFIGEIIFYPVYGAGVIINIEEMIIQGKKDRYYIINFVKNNITIMLPISEETNRKVRKGITKYEWIEIKTSINGETKKLPEKWSERVILYNKIIKQGDIYNLFDILKSITELSKTKHMSKSEIKYFDDIIDMASSEICLVMGERIDKVNEEIRAILGWKFH